MKEERWVVYRSVEIRVFAINSVVSCRVYHTFLVNATEWLGLGLPTHSHEAIILGSAVELVLKQFNRLGGIPNGYIEQVGSCEEFL